MKTKAYKAGFDAGFESGVDNNQFESSQDRTEYNKDIKQEWQSIAANKI